MSATPFPINFVHREVERQRGKRIKKHLSLHIDRGFYRPTRQNVIMLSKGHGSWVYLRWKKEGYIFLSVQRRILTNRSLYIYRGIYPVNLYSLQMWFAFRWLLAETTPIQHFNLALLCLLNWMTPELSTSRCQSVNSFAEKTHHTANWKNTSATH